MTGPTPHAPRWISGIEPAPELLTANGTQILELECRQQPALLRGLIEAYSHDSETREELKTLHQLGQRNGPVFFIGMGASLCSSISASTLLQSHGRLSFSLDAGEWLHYALPIWGEAAVSVPAHNFRRERRVGGNSFGPPGPAAPWALSATTRPARAGKLRSTSCPSWPARSMATQPRPIPTQPQPQLSWLTKY